MSEFLLTYKKVLQNEGGYNRPFRESGETYKGIDRSYFPNWPGWKIIDGYKAANGVPPEEYVYNDAQLENYVMQWYIQYLSKVIDMPSIINQTLADFVADFIVHKLYDAIAVINAVAATMPEKFNTSKYVVQPGIIYLMNKYTADFYTKLKYARIEYYRNPATFGSKLQFSTVLQNSFINRVNNFPDTA